MSSNSLVFSVAKLCFDAGVSVEEKNSSKMSVDQIAFLNKDLERIVCSASKGMESVWREYAQKYHENVLITPDGAVSPLEKSHILPHIYEQVDWKALEELEEVDFVSEGEKRDFRDNVTIFFFEELAKTKRFPLKEISPDNPNLLDSVRMFADGEDIKWRNLEKFLS
jgi:hypothetical protein